VCYHHAGDDARLETSAVWLIIIYVALMILGDIADYLIGLAVESMWGAHVSLIVFLLLYFVFLWLAWLGAVKFTEPKVDAAHPA
jgi:hypothetical protein